nr:DUF3097 family protein [Dermatophilus congolensis]
MRPYDGRVREFPRTRSPHKPSAPAAAGWGRYSGDILAHKHTPPRGRSIQTPAEIGLVVEEVASGWVGAITRVQKAGGMQVVDLEDRRGRIKAFPLGPGFLIDGSPVTLTAPRSTPERSRTYTASGSRAVAQARARVALGSRIFVEGRHDAELVEKVWGDDLRVEGVVVEYVGGIDDLNGIITDFAPTAQRRLGILVDHLVPGSKEYRLVEKARTLQPWANHVHIVGHPFVDVWQSVKPTRVGLRAWPTIERGTDWKRGILAALGLPNSDQADIARGWQAILATVRNYEDLEPQFLGRVEELIDFVTAPTDTEN